MDTGEDNARGDFTAMMQQLERDIMAKIPALIQSAVVRAVNEYAAHLESGESGRFHAHMAREYPILESLAGASQKSIPPADSAMPVVAMIAGPCAEWNHLLPFGSKTGQVLVWYHDDKEWGLGTGLPEGEEDKQILVWHKFTQEEKKESDTEENGEWRVEDGFLPDGTTEGQVLRWHKYNQEEKEALQTDRPGEWQPGWVTAIESESQAES